ncbi:uncharacterized protein LOC128883726 isoform X2 [Hylaeus volcanicus]|uniref:uncharacterized protein LOC128883726 isoform X2 n=1 Tax=Hylaeus volcanicus TaxID=313075 RepID=UPI0023B80AB8|nr:uncharacterized protein LOC128883726 isoform X2 [Hylaeus volcanicus]
MSSEAKIQLDRSDLEIIRACLGSDNPIITQNLLSYSLNGSDHWMLEPWKDILSVVNRASNHFLFTLNEVQRVVDLALKEMGMLYATPAETLLDVASALSLSHCILKQDIVMKHIMEAYDPNLRRTFLKKVSNEPLYCVKGLNKPQPSVSLLQKMSNAVSEGFDFFMKVLERHLPFNEVSLADFTHMNTLILHFETIQTVAKKFLDCVKQNKFPDLADDPVMSMCNLQDSSGQCSILAMPYVLAFLEKNMRKLRSNDDAFIFAWFLAFYERDCNCQPFSCNIESDSTSSNATTVHGIKIVWNRPKTQDNGISNEMEITEADKAHLLEMYAEITLRSRIIDCDTKIALAATQCKNCLKISKKKTAILWVRKKKLWESQQKDFESQLLRLEEVKLMRDASSTLGVVTNVLHSSCTTTKTVLKETSRLAIDVSSFLEDSQQELNQTQNLFISSKNNSINDSELEEEYRTLLYDTMDEVPECELPQLKESEFETKAPTLLPSL